MVNVEGSLSADLIAQQNFSPARRGFDPEEVRNFLVKVAAEIVALHERQSALEDARRDAEYRAAHPSFDEETLFGAVGEETAHILKIAHEAAADIKAKAQENASRILKEAHQQAET
ncbi:MAG TPA: DivIVA domain-containing protein, partial [Acidimicrobiales bacterium]|nr:DivIVA domain-containing protein [Acidimicrobiales bacterium]